jgi:sugar lactone lactonase YvrE
MGVQVYIACLTRIMFICQLLVVLSSDCLAQSENNGPDAERLFGMGCKLPVNGEQATTQGLNAGPITLDGVGGFYVYSVNKIYHVEKDSCIYWVAGSGSGGDSGDGGKAIAAQLFYPDGLAVDTAGNLYIADTNNDGIRKVTPDGVITTVVGNGTKGFSGDGGLATSAQLRDVKGVAVDAAGNLFILDSGNYRIRKVAPDRIIKTVAGNTTAIYNRDGHLVEIRKDSDSIVPTCIAVDSAGNLYIIDGMRVLKVTPDGRIITIA